MSKVQKRVKISLDVFFEKLEAKLLIIGNRYL